MISVENQSAECVDIDPFAIVESSFVTDPSCDSVITTTPLKYERRILYVMVSMS